VTVSAEVVMNDQRSFEEFESAVAAMDEVVEARRVFGSPDYILRVLVADVAAYERFQTSKVLVLPGVSRTISHQTMKLIKRDLWAARKGRLTAESARMSHVAIVHGSAGWCRIQAWGSM
jgi:DNA-binding Lrp family transcriptional regulator